MVKWQLDFSDAANSFTKELRRLWNSVETWEAEIRRMEVKLYSFPTFNGTCSRCPQRCEYFVARERFNLKFRSIYSKTIFKVSNNHRVYQQFTFEIEDGHGEIIRNVFDITKKN